MATQRDWNRKFTYQLTDYMKRSELESFIEPFTADHAYENLHYVIKRKGAGDTFAIFIKESANKNTPKDISRRESVKR